MKKKIIWPLLFCFLIVKTYELYASPSEEKSINQAIVLWDQAYGGDGNESLANIIELDDGRFIIGGTSDSDVTIEGATIKKSSSNHGARDYWLVVTDEDGNREADYSYGGFGDDQLVKIIKLSDGGYLLAGSSDSGISGEKSETNRGQADFWLVKIDANFNKVWDKTFGTDAYDDIYNVAEQGGKIFVLGYGLGTGADKTTTSTTWFLRLSGAGSIEYQADFKNYLDDYYASSGHSKNPGYEQVVSMHLQDDRITFSGYFNFFQTDLDGNLNWIDGGENFRTGIPPQIVTRADTIFFAGVRNNPSSDWRFVTRVRTSLGELIDDPVGINSSWFYFGSGNNLSKRVNQVQVVANGALVVQAYEFPNNKTYIFDETLKLKTTLVSVGDYSFIASNDQMLIGGQTSVTNGDITIESFNTSLDWFADSDYDLYGDAENSTTSILFRTGYSLNDYDCDDSDQLTQAQKWYRDNDSDNYGRTDVVLLGNCTTSPEFPYIEIPGDCDDSDDEINPETFWYLDEDDDGFGNNSSAIQQCLQPDGYVRYNTDCDDSDSDEYPNATWYADSDNDDFGDPNISIQACERPMGYVSNNLDCDDSDQNLTSFLWYRDVDLDGYGVVTETIYACSQPNGYADNSDDCDDFNAIINPETHWYLDGDDDGYGTPDEFVVSCTQPDGYVINSDDCLDTDEMVNPDKIWYLDNDLDGSGDANTTTTTGCEQPVGYVSNSDDCDDSDVDFDFYIVYLDNDGDGYGQNDQTLKTCTIPVQGYALNADDCNDSNADQTPVTIWYADLDGDGFGNPNETFVDCEQPDGYILDNSDCDDTNPEASSEEVWYEDADEDGLGNQDVSVDACGQPDGYVADNTDCDDTLAGELPIDFTNELSGCGNVLMQLEQTYEVYRLDRPSETVNVTNPFLIFETGEYTLSVMSSSGCEASKTFNVTVFDEPVLDLGADRTICEGEVLDAGNTGANYSWSTGASSQMITPTTSGTYVVTVTSPDGCESSDEVVLDVLESPELNLQNASICPNVPVTFTMPEGLNSYNWYFENTNISSGNRLLEFSGFTETGTFEYAGEAASDLGCITREVFYITVEEDLQAPVPDLAELPEVNESCSVNTLTPPTATDECSGEIIGVSNVTLPIVSQGTSIISWTFTDESGNTAIQQQHITLSDSENPIPDVAVLPTIYSDCDGEINQPIAPTATDNCAGSIVGTTNQTFPFISTGNTEITWTYQDENGNIVIQQQQIEVSGIDEVTVSESLCEGSNFTFPDGTVWIGETTQISTLSNQQGCDSVITTNITVLPLPEVDLGTDEVFGCLGEELTFSIDESRFEFETYTISTLFGNTSTDGPLTFLFDNTLAASIASQDVFVTIELTNADGCVGTDQVQLFDNTMINWSNGILQNNDPEIVITNAILPETADAFEWAFGDETNNTTELNPTHTYTENGDYDVTLTVSNECGEESQSTTITIAGIDENTPLSVEDTIEISIFPNPFKDYLRIQTDEPIDVFVYSLEGKVNYQKSGIIDQDIDLIGLARGQYIVQLFKNGKRLKSEKILKIN